MRALPDLEREVHVSPNGGVEPVWSPDGRELFYRSGTRMMAVRVTNNADSPVGEETVLFEGDFDFDPSGDNSYDVFADGQSFVMVLQDVAAPRFRVVSGLLEELTRFRPVN